MEPATYREFPFPLTTPSIPRPPVWQQVTIFQLPYQYSSVFLRMSGAETVDLTLRHKGATHLPHASGRVLQVLMASEYDKEHE